MRWGILWNKACFKYSQFIFNFCAKIKVFVRKTKFSLRVGLSHFCLAIISEVLNVFQTWALDKWAISPNIHNCIVWEILRSLGLQDNEIHKDNSFLGPIYPSRTGTHAVSLHAYLSFSSGCEVWPRYSYLFNFRSSIFLSAKVLR